jgi:sec-independent protein translocase protein TatA
MPNLQPAEIIIIVLVLVLLFGAKKLPDTARGLGRSLRIFKAETKGLRNDDKDDADAGSDTGAQAAPQAEPRQISATDTSSTGSAPGVPSEQQTPAAPASGSAQPAGQDPDADRR